MLNNRITVCSNTVVLAMLFATGLPPTYREMLAESNVFLTNSLACKVFRNTRDAITNPDGGVTTFRAKSTLSFGLSTFDGIRSGNGSRFGRSRRSRSHRENGEDIKDDLELEIDSQGRLVEHPGVPISSGTNSSNPVLPPIAIPLQVEIRKSRRPSSTFESPSQTPSELDINSPSPEKLKSSSASIE